MPVFVLYGMQFLQNSGSQEQPDNDHQQKSDEQKDIKSYASIGFVVQNFHGLVPVGSFGQRLVEHEEKGTLAQFALIAVLAQDKKIVV